MPSVPVPWYLNPVLLPALFGFVGVIVGGIISGTSSYLVERFRAKHQRDVEARALRREVVQAARLIDAELEDALATVLTTIEKQMWWPSEDPEIAKWDVWREHRATIASHISAEDWLNLQKANGVIRALHAARVYAGRVPNSDPTFPAVPESQTAFLERATARLAEARAIISKVCDYESSVRQ